MKKILLSIMLISAFAIVRGQSVVLNEVYGNPGSGNSEYVELYNSSSSGSLDCYTLMTYYENEGGSAKGWYVLDLPTTSSIGTTPGFFVLAPANTFSVQGTPGAIANLNWNDATFRGGTTGGYLKKFEWNGSGYTDLNLLAGTTITNLLDGTLNGGQIYITLLFKNGVLINGFVGGGSSGSIPTLLGNLGSLTFPIAGACSPATSTVNFGTLPVVEFFNPSGGNDNGYARSSDGKCGAWVKTAPQVNHTPGATNGSASGITGSLSTAQLINCAASPRTITADVTAISGSVTLADDFPVVAYVYHDANTDGILNDGTYFDTLMFQNVTDGGRTTHPANPLPDQNGDYIIAYRTQRGCFDVVVRLQNACATLPIKLQSFTAVRYRSNVVLEWETAMEDNNLGFEVQRKIGNTDWNNIAFVASKAQNGNSNEVLNYELNDVNATKGITQYRLKQIETDRSAAYSAIRSVRGEGQYGKTIIYPNPSNNGNVNVVFEDANVVRNITLIDMNGRTVKQWKGVTNNNIQMENLHAGFYTVRIVNAETSEQVVEKIVVNKR